MSSTDLPSQSSSSMDLSSVNSIESMKFPTFDEFLASYIRQHFSIPESIVFYMAKNPSSQNVYQKLIESCKYFFFKNPVLTFHCLHFEDNQWKTCNRPENRKYHKIDLDLEKMQSKIWVNCRVKISSPNSTLASSLIPKLYNGNVKCLELWDQHILFNDLLSFLPKLKRVIIHRSFLLYPNGTEVPLEIILANLPMIDTVCFGWANASYNLSKTVKELLKIPHFKNLKHFFCRGISESFDIATFFEYLKKNKRTKVKLGFYGLLSEEYKEKLESIVDEILNAEAPRPYVTPYIRYIGQDLVKKEALYNLFKTVV